MNKTNKPEVSKVEVGDESWKPEISSGSAGGFVDLYNVSPEFKEEITESIADELREEGKRPQKAYYEKGKEALQIFFLH